MKFETPRTRVFQLAALMLLVASLLIACGGEKDDPQPTDTPVAAASVQEEATATEPPSTNTPEPTESPEQVQPKSPLSQTVSPLAQPRSPLAQPESPLDTTGG